MNDKTITFYTSTVNSRKILKHHTQILLTVTPPNQKDLFVTQTPLAWKVLDFPPHCDTQYTVTWHADPGFNVVGRYESSIHVPLGGSGVLRDNGGGGVSWTNISGKRGSLMARNETRVPQVFTLGSQDEDDQFEGFVRFVHTQGGGAVSVEPAVMLQAYSVTGYKDGKPLSQVDAQSFIFKKYDGTPQPQDLRTLSNDTSFMLSSESSGRVTLE